MDFVQKSNLLLYVFYTKIMSKKDLFMVFRIENNAF